MSAPASRGLPTVLRAVAVVAGAATLFVGAVGFAHTPSGRPLLRALRGSSCPLGLGAPLTAEQSEAGRQRALLAFKGEVRASARPALGFVLGETTKADVERWVAAHGVVCRPDGPTTLTCKDVPAGALPAPHDAHATSVSLRWNPAGLLVAAVTTRSGIGADEAARMHAAIAGDVRRAAGSPSIVLGEPTAEYLATSLHQVRTEFRFSDYRAEVLATRVGSEVVLSEEYQSIAD